MRVCVCACVCYVKIKIGFALVGVVLCDAEGQEKV